MGALVPLGPVTSWGATGQRTLRTYQPRFRGLGPWACVAPKAFKATPNPCLNRLDAQLVSQSMQSVGANIIAFTWRRRLMAFQR